LVNEANNTRFYNELYGRIKWYYRGNPYVNRSDVLININGLKILSITPVRLVNYLNLVLSGGKLPPDVITVLTNYIRSVAYNSYSGKGVERSLEALYLVMSSPYYLIQR